MGDNLFRRCFPEPVSVFDIIIMCAMISVFLGLIISTVGYLVPRESLTNPTLTAREQEAQDIYYYNLSNNLDICVVVGMGLIGLGGVLTSAVFCKTIICRECEVGDRDEENYTLTDHTSGVLGHSYGTLGEDQGQGQLQGQPQTENR